MGEREWLQHFRLRTLGCSEFGPTLIQERLGRNRGGARLLPTRYRPRKYRIGEGADARTVDQEVAQVGCTCTWRARVPLRGVKTEDAASLHERHFGLMGGRPVDPPASTVSPDSRLRTAAPPGAHLLRKWLPG